MSTGLLCAGAGLLLLEPVPVARRRLDAMTGGRLPAGMGSSRPDRPKLGHGRFRSGAAVLACALVALVLGPGPGALAAAALLVGRHCLAQLRSERAALADAVRLAAVISALAAEHDAGADLASALAVTAAGAGRWQAQLRSAGQRAAAGLDLVPALPAEPILAPVAVALALATRSGAALSPVLARVRADLIARVDERRALAEAMAGPRSSAVLLAGLPVVGVVLGIALGADPLQVLLHTTPGLVLLLAGGLLDLAGLFWTIRLTR